ncbi:MAG: glycine cleavage system protein GcvH [Burkholderiales bacterium]|nr:glycine cleavage system protein GcvH [Burkholderiales bacterium]
MSQAQRTEGAPDQRLASGSSAAGPLRSLSAVNNPADLKYTASHEWLRREADGSAVVGITFHAQDALGELVYVELPEVGRQLKQGEACVVVESTKAASDVYAPVDGEVIAINEALTDAPQTVNEAPYEAGWLFRIRPSAPAQIDALLGADDYAAGPGAG